MKHVHHVPESCLRHCIEGVSEVDVDSIDSLSLSVGEIKVVPVGKFAALRPGRRAAVFADAMANDENDRALTEEYARSRPQGVLFL